MENYPQVAEFMVLDTDPGNTATLISRSLQTSSSSTNTSIIANSVAIFDSNSSLIYCALTIDRSLDNLVLAKFSLNLADTVYIKS